MSLPRTHAQLALVNVAALTLMAGEESAMQLLKWQDRATAFHELADAISRTGAEVSKTPDEWWREGLLDEIYEVPPASKKGAVKTGAIDSIVARHAVHGVKRYGAALAVTSDKALVTHLNGAGANTVQSVQDAIGQVADSASLKVARSLAKAMLDQGWATTFVELLAPGRFNAESRQTIEILGLSNAAHTMPGLLASVVFSIDDVVNRETPDGEDDPWYGGTEIWAAEALVDEETFAPTRVFSVSLIEPSFDFADYPGTLSELGYVETEKLCLPSPQADVLFAASSPELGGSPTGIITVTLGQDVVATVEFIAAPQRHESEYGTYTTLNLELHVTGPVTQIHARKPVTNSGFLGARMFRMWANTPWET